MEKILYTKFNTTRRNIISKTKCVKMIHFSVTQQALIEQTIESPYDPYLESNENWYPPFVQLLLVLGIIQNHPDNPSLIRMTPFHH